MTATNYHQISLNESFFNCRESSSMIPLPSSLKPVLSDFFALHPDFHPDTFLDDSAFDVIETYCFLKEEFHFSKALIPYNPRNESTFEKVGYNIYGYPTCAKDSSLAMKYARHCHEKGRSDREKRVCPKVHMVNGEWGMGLRRTIVERAINHFKTNMSCPQYIRSLKSLTA